MSKVTQDLAAYQNPEISATGTQQAFAGPGSSTLTGLAEAQANPPGTVKTELYGGDLIGQPGIDLEQGFAKEALEGANARQDSDGTNYVGNPFEREGFLTPGLGYDR